MTAATFTDAQKEDLPRALKGNLCRCTGYRAIEDAVSGVVGDRERRAGPGRRNQRRRAGGHRRGDRPRRVHDGHRAWRACCTSRCCTRRTPTPGSCRSTRPPRSRSPACTASTRWEDVPRKRFTTAIHTDHLVDPDDTYMLDNVGALRRPARRRGRSPTPVGAAEEGCRKVVVEYEVLPAVFDPEEAMADGAPQLHGSDDPFVRDPEHNILLEIHGAHRRRRGRLRRGRRDPRGHVLLAAGAARAPRDPRLDRLDGGRPAERPHQLAVAVDRQGQARPPVRPAPRPAPRVLQARRRRLRRQAGGDRRGPGRARHAGHRAAGLLRVHPRGGVHHGARRGTR